MTEYTTSPDAIQEFMNARERCAYWVQAHSSDRDGFYSPSVPPTEIEHLIPSSPPSDAGSSHSLPPKMVLRYRDGRPDIPIPHPNLSSRRRERDHRRPPHDPPPQPAHHCSHTSTHPHPSPPLPVHRPSRRSDQERTSRHPEPVGANAGSPEEIRVLPSHAPSHPLLPPRSAATSSHRQRSHHSRSRSLPRTVNNPDHLPDEAVPHGSQYRPVAYPPPTSPHSPSPHTLQNHPAGPGHWHGMQSSSGSTKYSRGHSSHKVPPAIIYAPSHHTQAPHYTPPAILYHQPPRGPDGMIYSHSAPVPIQGGSYPSPMSPNSHEVGGRRDRARSLGPGVVHKVSRSDDGEGSDAGSVGSGSTYYVLPSAGQKVHVIAPSPGQSILTATSTTKSSGQSPRKPFFQRLFGFAKIGSSTGESIPRGRRRKLHRRHSTGDSEPADIELVDPALEGENPN